jgi:fumarylacetoacetate (FAA) hydrolase
VRVFSAFERHETPFFSFRNTAPIYGPESRVPYPDGTRELDFGLGIAAVIGADGAIGGLTLANDWTARDLERIEREAGFGPSKSKDFALSIGPLLVTLDELEGTDGTVVAKVNGEERARCDLDGLAYSWQDLADHAGRNSGLRPGDLLVCTSGASAGSWLEPGDAVEIGLAGIGVLRNVVDPPA